MTRVINTREHKGWGNTVSWFTPPSYGKRKKFYRSEKKIVGTFVGWLPERPVVGDIIQSPTSEPTDALWKITEVDYMRDPDDMFFATVEYIGQKED